MKQKFPLPITRRGVTAKIHRATQIQHGRRYTGYLVTYRLLGKLKRVWRSQLEDAKSVATEACDKIASGDHLALELTSSDRMTYLRAIQPLAPIGVELDVAARDYASAIKELPPGVTLRDVVDFFRRRNASALEKRTVREVANEMLAAKRKANLSNVYVGDLEIRLNRFAADFQMNIGDVSGKLIQAWLDTMNRSGRTRRNYLHAVSALFRFATRRKYLPKDALDEIAAVERPSENLDEIEIFRPDEIAALLATANKLLVPFIAIGGFAGLRSSEILRLNWQDVRFDSGSIIVQKGKVKKRGQSRRIVPLLPNLGAWLAPYANRTGSVWPYSKPYLYELLAAITAKAKVAWKDNALRHSFVSYRVAQIKNIPQVAFECGNSPQMIASCYRELVTEQDAQKWFAITPPGRARSRKGGAL